MGALVYEGLEGAEETSAALAPSLASAHATAPALVREPGRVPWWESAPLWLFLAAFCALFAWGWSSAGGV
jgi:hypothetical protein